MGLIQLVQLLAAIVPLIHPVVQVVEQAFPNAKQGAAKLDAALSVISSILPAAGATVEQIAALESPIKAVIGTVVAGLNASGVFKH